MIEDFCAKLINELGATGVLVVGLIWILYLPLRQISKSLEIINEELGQIRDILKTSQHQNKD